MIIDYKNKENAIACGVEDADVNGDIFFRGAENYEGITFKNFPNLHLEEADYKNCTFEDCGVVSFYDGEIVGCKFHNVSEIEGHFASFMDCAFSQCCSQGPFLTIDNVGSVEGCTFETITALGDDGYIIFSVYGKKKDVRYIKNCKFIDCKVESEDGLYTYCVYYKRCLACKTIEIENVDMQSCVFGEGADTDWQTE